MLNNLYQTLYRAANLAVAGLQMLNLSPQQANKNLTELVQNEGTQNPGIVRVQQKPTSLESFLIAKYTIKKEGNIPKDTRVPQKEIPHYHSRKIGVIKDGKLEFQEQPYLESVLVYITANDSNKMGMHIIVDFKPDFTIQYTVILPESGDTATVIDPAERFNEGHFKEKIEIYLMEEKSKGKKSL